MIQFIPITTKHISSICSIYNWYVAHTTVSFDIDPANMEKMQKLTIHDDPRFVSYAIEQNNKTVGYVMLSPFIHKHASYRSAEVTIYLDSEASGKGIGKQALQFIEQQAVSNGFYTLVAVICTENSSSIAAFQKQGYHLKGIVEQIAYKFDRFLDVSYYQKLLL